MPRSSKLHDISVIEIHQTAKAILYDDGGNQFWVPKSIMGEDGFVQVEADKDGPSGALTLTAPEWWLKDRGLI